MGPSPEFVTLREASRRSGLSIRTLRRRIADGQLTAYRSGPASNSPIVVRVSDLDALLTLVEVGR